MFSANKAKNLIAAAVLAVGGLFTSSALAAPITDADVIFIVDESGSMAGEHTFLNAVIGDLDTALSGAGVTGRRYGLVGFGAANPAPRDVGFAHFGGAAGLWMDATDFATATGDLVLSGGTEDGYAGINYALNTFSFAPGAAINLVLVTDEDRDDWDGVSTYNSTLSAINRVSGKLNGILNIALRDGGGATALGVDDDGNAYLPDGSGGYTTSSGGVAIGGSGSTVADYFDLAIDTHGAAWDLNQLRSGGLLATSFTSAFVDIKVQEIITPPGIPEPATLALFGIGLAGLGFASRRRKAA